jgi:acetylornithine deacetylase/succinyl-diaminopimelate desuccinylase-like protein
VGEPSNLNIVHAHKGHLICRFRIPLTKKSTPSASEKNWEGLAAHSSTPHLGKNAFTIACSEIEKKRQGIVKIQAGTNSNKVPDLCTATLTNASNPHTDKLFTVLNSFKELEAQLKKSHDKRFSPDTPTLSFNLVTTTAKSLELTFDIRLLPNNNPDKIRHAVETILRQQDAELCELTLDPPLNGGKGGRLVKHALMAGRAAGFSPLLETKASSTEAAIYAVHGGEAIIFGPGISIGNVHRPNEFNFFSHLKLATAFYTELIGRL